MTGVVYDTNIASLAVKSSLPADLAARLAGTEPVLSFVTVGELGKRAEVRAWGPRPRGAADAWTASRQVIDSDDTVSRTWGRLARPPGGGVTAPRRTICGSRPAAWPRACRW